MSFDLVKHKDEDEEKKLLSDMEARLEREFTFY
jgi:hypothetical protein